VQVFQCFTDVDILDKNVKGLGSLMSWCCVSCLILRFGGQHGPLEWFGEAEETALADKGLIRPKVKYLNQKWFIGLHE